MYALLEDIGEHLASEAWQDSEAASPLHVPAGPAQLAGHYDLSLSHPSIELPQLRAFERWLAQAAARRGLSCALLHDGVVEEAIRRLEQGRLTIGFHLDYFALWHVANDPYARLAQAVQDSGGHPVNQPPRSRRFTDKAAAHAELFSHGFGVPETVLLQPGVGARPLTDRERAGLRIDEPGARLYLKPANGFGQHGVIRLERTDTESILAALADARRTCPQDTLLVQRGVSCPSLADDDGQARPAYWRVLYCLGEIIPFWWSRAGLELGQPSYRRLTASQCRRHGLWPMLTYVHDLAELCGLDWFSTELCLSTRCQRSRYTVVGFDTDHEEVSWPVLAIDYVNDQCDVDVQSRWLGAPPDTAVRHIAERFAEAAASEKRRLAVRPTPLRLFAAA